MTENQIVYKDRDKKNEIELDKDLEKHKHQQQHSTLQKEQLPKTEQHDSRFRRLSQFLDLLNIPRHHSGHSGSSSSSNNSQQHSPQTPHATIDMPPAERRSSNANSNNNATGHDVGMIEQEHQQQQQHFHQSSSKRSSCVSFRSEILLFDLVNGEINDFNERSQSQKDDYGTQRVYKKSSPNSVLTMYLPSREIILSGNSSSELEGIVYADSKAIQGYRIYAQLTLTFRYGREDEEVMGLRFCNEAVMSLNQAWPEKDEPDKPTLSPLQEALLKRLGEGAHAFTLTLTAQAPPSVQLVPAKRYYGAPIGTSYDVRCFIADKTDEKFHRRASVKMGVRVIYRTDVFNHSHSGPENFAALINNPAGSPTTTLDCKNTRTTASSPIDAQTIESSELTAHTNEIQQLNTDETVASSSMETRQPSNKPRKSERGDSFPKLRLSPKTFRFSSRFGRSKSEVDKCPNDAFYNYSKSFQEYDCACPIGCPGPQGAVDKPFLLQDGRVGLRASLDKAWYTHGEEVCVTINIRNDSKKTVRKIRVCAIQHVDVCMFNNGKFKNVVADSDNITPPPVDQHVAPGATFNTTIILKPQRGATKNWIALEDTLQRSTEPDEINANIAASAVRTPHFLMQTHHSSSTCTSPSTAMPATQTTSTVHVNPTNDERNVFAIYVSYYVKVKLTLSGMGGELSLKLPFMLVHIDEKQRQLHEMHHNLNLQEVPMYKRNDNITKNPLNKVKSSQEFALSNNLDRIESVDEGNLSRQISPLHVKDSYKAQTILRENIEGLQVCSNSYNERRRVFKRSETLAQDLEPEEEETMDNKDKNEQVQVIAQIHSTNYQQKSSSLEEENLEFSNQTKVVTNNSNHSPGDDSENFSEKCDNKELNLASTTTLKTETNGV